MKNVLLLIVLVALGFTSVAQTNRALIPDHLKSIAAEKQPATLDPVGALYNNNLIPRSVATTSIDMHVIGNTIFDLQTNSSTQNRIYLYDDGFIGGTWSFGLLQPGFADRGTGYNSFDGTSWGAYPTTRIEAVRTGWPSYAPLGANGEMIVSHAGGTVNLVGYKRTNKGTGTWDPITMAPVPTGATGLLWPRMITSGTDNNTIHLIALTTPVANGGVVYQGIDGALLYFRSSDGGLTWDIPGIILPGMDSTYYPGFIGFSGDTYGWLAPNAGKIAFIIGDPGIDLFIMVSEDDGTTWTKTLIWENTFKGLLDTPVFYCPDGSHHGAIDNSGKIHVAFGLNASEVDAAGDVFWRPFLGGIVYWNSDMPGWIGGDSLTLHPDTLYNSGHLLGYEIDVNGNGQWDLVCLEVACIGNYFLGSTSMPQLVIDDNNDMMLIFSSITEGFDDGLMDYRKIWGRFSPDGGYTWGDPYHLTDDLIHLFDECVFSSAAANSDGSFHFIYQADEHPGLALPRPDPDHPWVENFIYHMAVDKVMVGLNEYAPEVRITNISQNFPNPFRGKTEFIIELTTRSEVTVNVYNITGQKIASIEKGFMNSGHHRIELDMTGKSPGLYFYTVKAADQLITRKMVVD
ncbi:MAG TPA: T9SS type A sorting domain-containing protein [Bacteroidales bacterium]|nr:T9SS type A sorting domain-containing protein [Bacteroidales bacterium]